MTKRSYFMAAALVAIVIALGVLAVPESQPLAHMLLDPAALTTGLIFAAAGPTAPITSKKIRELQAKKAKQIEAMRALADKADGGAFSAEDQAEYDKVKAQVQALNDAIAREAELVAEEAQLGVLEVREGAVVTVHERAEDDPKRGFTNFGQFAYALRAHPMGESSARPGFALGGQLHFGAAAPTVFGGEGVGSDGGFIVPPEFATEIFLHALGEDSLLPLTDGTTVSGNSMQFPKDETTPWGTDGVRAYWQSEGLAGTQTKPKLSMSLMRLYKLMALVPVSDEQLDDSNQLNTYLPRKVGDSIRWKTNEAILFGSGAGQPLGAFNGSAVVTIAKESGQATLTLLPLNIGKMIARLPAGSFARALWLINNDVIPALYTLTLASYPIYMPMSAGIQTSPYGMLSGRPIQVTQHAKSFTNQGDVLLIDPQYVRSIQKASGIQTAASMHLYFDADATAFRTTFRVDAQPKIVNPIAPFNGSNNLSPFVQLGAR